MLEDLKVELHRAVNNMPNHLWKEFKQKIVKGITCSIFFGGIFYQSNFSSMYHLCVLAS